MHENSGNSVIYYAHYTEGGVNKTGLTVTITVYEVIRDGTKTEVVTDGACTEIGDGLYRYLLASGTVDAAAEYVAVFHTATDTVDAQDIPAMWVIDRAGSEKLDNGVTLADDAITAAKFDESTAFPLKSADTGSTQVARVGADSDTLETLSDEIAAVKAETAAILVDTGTDGVVVASLATDSITAAALKADAVTEIQNGLALEATLTAIKGAGWTTETLAAIDVLIDAIKAKTDQIVFTTPNRVDATATVDPTGIATSAELEAVDDKIDAIKVKTDALDNSAVTFVTAVNGTTITILRGDTLEGSLTDLGDLTDYVSIDFTVKESYSQTDDEAIIRIRKNASGVDDGLLRFNGEAPSSGALGSIAIDDLASGDITITLDETAADDLDTDTYVYDIQMISAAGVRTLTYGKVIVSADVTRLVA